MEKKKTYIAYRTIEEAIAAMRQMGRKSKDWERRIETIAVKGRTLYLVDAGGGKGYDILFEKFVEDNKKLISYDTAKSRFIAMTTEATEEDKAILGWDSTYFNAEPKMSLRRATKEYLIKRVEETGNQTKSSDYQLKRQEYLDLGGSRLPDE
jgi:hypothetical protein